MKVCYTCKIEKDSSQFWSDKSKKSGLNSNCIPCSNKKSLAVRERNREKTREQSRLRYKSNPLSDREKHLRRKYGIDHSQYESMFVQQGGVCAICGKSQKRRFDVDHCHKSGDVRGLLCTSCNRMLGHAGDNPEILIKGSVYLNSYQSSRLSSSKRPSDILKIQPKSQP